MKYCELTILNYFNHTKMKNNLVHNPGLVQVAVKCFAGQIFVNLNFNTSHESGC